MFEITIPLGSTDLEIFIAVVNQGIDSRLEGFTRSEFTDNGTRAILNFDETELPILIRRLVELNTDEADFWADDIVEAAYHWHLIQSPLT